MRNFDFPDWTFGTNLPISLTSLEVYENRKCATLQNRGHLESKGVKIAFELVQDEDGYPPDQWETMWAKETGSGLYSVDNIPFFTRGVSPGDVVRVRKEDGTLIFDGVVNPSPASVFRIFVSNSADVQAARDEFREMGCESELSYITRLFAVEVPGTVDFGQVAKLLAKGTETGRWEYEEGALRHNLPAE